ncbi:herpesvirus latent membrane protein 1 (LMP1) domain-containing protein [Purpureocillium lavendulum]|uniref:Herpesvirus latent membrane protein 1 (LMP1) domain-containing protein n=1 Tax=Purpureocillium lavendulum TaxID=1247861 RepID=A0AB34G4H2_9HYPO|nr:herpesvirus latent membrane protein 1 (LMP1) domain-containing protein [Purpureocillium lavendulum]
MAPTDFLRQPLLSPFIKGDSILSRRTETVAKPWKPVVLPGSDRLFVPSFREITRRSDGDDGSDNMINLLLIILGLVFLALILASLLFIFQRRRRLMRQRMQTLPTHNETKQTSNHRGLTIETSHNGRSSILYIGRDGQPMLQNPNSPPHSPDNVPEIHITFPDEQDDQGRSRTGRVLVVRVGDNATVGLEPMHEEQLPAYEKEAKGQFQSIDMDQIGGLKEKDRNLFQ